MAQFIDLDKIRPIDFPSVDMDGLDVVKYLATLPTVDTVEVVHGKWMVKHNPIDDPKGYFIRIVCSQCDLHTGQKSNYCPQCGAKMDK